MALESYRSREMKEFNDDHVWEDWSKEWPGPDRVMERFFNQHPGMAHEWPLVGWRNWPAWRQWYPRWAEPVFAEGLNVKSQVSNDRDKFQVNIDAYQFKPEEIQVKMVDDTVVVEGRHEDVKDRENYTKLNFVRKYLLPSDVDPDRISSSIDWQGRLNITAPKKGAAITGRERMIPIEAPSSSGQGQLRNSSRNSGRSRHDSGTGSMKNGDNGGGRVTESRASTSRTTHTLRKEFR